MPPPGAQFVTGDGRQLDIDDISEVYRDVVNLSTPYSGRIQHLGRNDFSLTCQFVTTDCDVLDSVETNKTYSLKTTSRNNGKEKYIESVRCMTGPRELAEIAVAVSDNNRYLARLKFGSNYKQLLEIWDHSKLLKTIDTSATHGQINTDRVFASFRWCSFGEQDKLLYVCRAKKNDIPIPFGQDEDDEDRNGDQGIKTNARKFFDPYAKKESWGEGLVDIEHTKVVMLDVGQGFKTSTLDMKSFSLADSRWLDGLRTVSVAYAEEPVRFPLMVAKHAPSKLVVHDWNHPTPKLVLELHDVERCFSSPRVDNSGKKFLYCVASSSGLENQPIELYLYDMDTSRSRKLEDSQSKDNEHFMFRMNDNCFTSDDKNVLFMKHDHLYHQMCLFSLESSSITRIKFPTTAIHLLDFRHDIILAVGSEVNATPTVFVSILNPADAGELVAWHQIEECLHLNEIEYQPYQIPTSDGSTFISGLLITPNIASLHKNFVTRPEQLASGKLINTEYDLPTVISIHGGPQSTYIANYMHNFVTFARLGLRSLLINYRGSSGVDKQYLYSLSGNVGKVDVDDCLEAIRHFVKNKLINQEKLILYGGSYGGFLSCHLSCQDEFKFSSAIIWNPLVDISLLRLDRFSGFTLGTTESNAGYVPSPKEMTKLFESSPISRHSQAHVPTLILLGSRDTCVPKNHGEMWFELLKAKGVKTRCKIYEDGHSLGRVESQLDSTITSITWILSNLQSIS